MSYWIGKTKFLLHSTEVVVSTTSLTFINELCFESDKTHVLIGGKKGTLMHIDIIQPPSKTTSLTFTEPFDFLPNDIGEYSFFILYY